MLIKNCTACNKEYKIKPYLVNISKFCSKECQNHKQYEHRSLICKGCRKKFQVSLSRTNKKFCSIECKSLIAKDIKEVRKQHKIIQIKRRGYISGKNLKKKLKLIRNLYCDICHYNEYDFCLDVHHIDENPKNNNLNNLSILCAFCHRKLHKKLVTLEIKNAA